MITIKETLNGSCPPLTAGMFHETVFPEKTLALDIETTGLSASDNRVYLIGCACMENGVWVLRQWLAESENEERDVLAAFLDFASPFSALLHYNGDRFDLPFLKERFSRCGLNSLPASLTSLDLYRYARPLKEVLGIEDLKQVTVERFLGVEREDKYSGRELIDVFKRFMLSHDDKSRGELLLHNADDIRGLLSCLSVLSYEKLVKNTGDVRVKKAEARAYEDIHEQRRWELYLELTLPLTLPAPVSIHRDGCFLKAERDHAVLRVPIFDGELKYFYAGWRDYYYLPDEDTALHKSVAEYVDRAYRVKATAATCYTRKQSRYLQQWDALFEPFFRKSYEDRALYFELTDERKKSRDDLGRYAGHVIEHITGS